APAAVGQEAGVAQVLGDNGGGADRERVAAGVAELDGDVGRGEGGRVDRPVEGDQERFELAAAVGGEGVVVGGEHAAGVLGRDRLDGDQPGRVQTVVGGFGPVQVGRGAEAGAAVDAGCDAVHDAGVGGVVAGVVVADVERAGDRIDGDGRIELGAVALGEVVS